MSWVNVDTITILVIKYYPTVYIQYEINSSHVTNIDLPLVVIKPAHVHVATVQRRKKVRSRRSWQEK